MSGFHVDTASSVSILMKEVVRPSLKNRWQGSHSISRPTRGKERGEPKRGGRRNKERKGDKRRNKEEREKQKIKTDEEQRAKEERRKSEGRAKEGRRKEGRKETVRTKREERKEKEREEEGGGGESEQWLEQKEEYVERVLKRNGESEEEQGKTGHVHLVYTA